MCDKQSARLEVVLNRGGIKTKSVWFNNQHGVITCWSFDMAYAAARALSATKQFKVSGPRESRDDAKDQANRKTIAPKRVPVWRVWIRLLPAEVTA